MKTILFKEAISPLEYQELRDEFHHTHIKFAPGTGQLPLLEADQWRKVEAIYCSEWTQPETNTLSALRWIHFTGPQPRGLKQSDLGALNYPLITITRGVHTQPFMEYILGAVLSFSKNLFAYHHNPSELHIAPTWTLQQKKALLISPGKIGSIIAKELSLLGMTVWGVQETRSFHPHCHRMFPWSELHSLLPAVDIVYLYYEELAGAVANPISALEMNLMRPGSILVLIGAGERFDFPTLAKIAVAGTLRGIIVDTTSKIPPQAKEALDKAPNAVVTPGIAGLPAPHERLAFRTFRYNLRFFYQELFDNMKNLISLSPLHTEDLAEK